MKLTQPIAAIMVNSAGRYVRFFADREDAGAHLARYLSTQTVRDPLVLGLVRGGVPVAAEVARELGGEPDMVVARKLGAPTSHELAIGAVTADGGFYLNKPLIRELAIPTAYVERITEIEIAEAKRQEQRLRVRPPPSVLGRNVVLVDDGLATGATMIAAVRSVRARSPARVVVAVPVGSGEAVSDLRNEADSVFCLVIPEPFWAVGLYYRNFEEVDDAEVRRLLEEAAPVNR